MPSKKIKIRPYSPEDAKDLATIYFQTIHQINSKDYTPEQINAWAPQSSLEEQHWLKKFEKTKPFVATVESDVVGFAEFEPNGHIDCFYCHHEWLGCGVGSALMRAIVEKATQLNLQQIYAEVSLTAKSFFDRWDFITVKEQTVTVNGIKLKNYKMKKTI